MGLIRPSAISTRHDEECYSECHVFYSLFILQSDNSGSMGNVEHKMHDEVMCRIITTYQVLSLKTLQRYVKLRLMCRRNLSSISSTHVIMAWLCIWHHRLAFHDLRTPCSLTYSNADCWSLRHSADWFVDCGYKVLAPDHHVFGTPRWLRSKSNLQEQVSECEGSILHISWQGYC